LAEWQFSVQAVSKECEGKAQQRYGPKAGVASNITEQQRGKRRKQTMFCFLPIRGVILKNTHPNIVDSDDGCQKEIFLLASS
jgi:hypothetical protein